MNQQQLQIARAALWHQSAGHPASPETSAQSTGALHTTEEAARWLDDLGFCLFLPRHTQLAAPAPSFVEACMGTGSLTPPPGAIAHAAELAARLIADHRAVPLNLLGTHSEQPDFLITPEVLPWIAAIRGERQWKTAPPGRVAPLVMRTWEALDREGTVTAIQLSEILGREVTEAAVLRALIALWTSLRAIPLPTPGGPTQWTLLKNRFPAQLATGSNTSQATGLSALLSLYLRSAVAATAEEAEVFLSPLTSRSRIREVLHGMMAARQFATMSVGTHTLLFVEGSLPETLPEPEAPPPEQTAAAAPPAFAAHPRPGREERPLPARPYPKSERSGPARFAGARDDRPRSNQRSGPRFEKREGAPDGGKKPWQRREGRPASQDSRPPRPWQKREPAPQGGSSRPARPWQKREAGPESSGTRPARPWQKREAAPQGRSSRPTRPWQRREAGPEGSGTRPARPWQKREARPAGSGPRPWQKKREPGAEPPQERREARGRFGDRPSGERREGRPGRKPVGRAGRPWQSRGGAPGDRGFERREPSPGRPPRPATAERPPRKFGTGRDKNQALFQRSAGTGKRSERPGNRPPRPGGRSQGRPGPPWKKSMKKPFRKSNSAPGKENSRKNHSQEETPE